MSGLRGSVVPKICHARSRTRESSVGLAEFIRILTNSATKFGTTEFEPTCRKTPAASTRRDAPPVTIYDTRPANLQATSHPESSRIAQQKTGQCRRPLRNCPLGSLTMFTEFAPFNPVSKPNRAPSSDISNSADDTRQRVWIRLNRPQNPVAPVRATPIKALTTRVRGF